EQDRMILNSAKEGPLDWGLPPDVYSLVNHHNVTKEIWDKVKLLMKGTELSQQERECDDQIACLNKAIEFMSTIMASRFPSNNNQLITSSNPRNQATIQNVKVTVQQVQRRHGQSFAGMRTKENAASSRGNNAADPGTTEGQVTQKTIPQNAIFQTDDLDAYDSDCDDISSTKVVLMANPSSYDSDVLFEVPHYETYQKDDMINQSVQEMRVCKKCKMRLFKILTLLHNKMP
nr:hypothetical protein [Tanacetum cinerariifolium]